MERKAIDSTGRLGCPYDKQQDCIVKGWTRTADGRSSCLPQSPKCKLINGNRDASINLLQFIDIEDELRLNLLLDITKRHGIASVMNYHDHIDEQTRILYYSYIDRKEEVVNITDIAKWDKLSDFPRQATHIITGINFGIDVVVILQLPAKSDITINFDSILRKVYDVLLSNDSNVLSLTLEEKHSLEKITDVQVYSNIAAFTSLNKVPDVLETIDRLKGDTNHRFSHPVSYYLRPTTQLPSQYKDILRDISPMTIKDIEQCLLLLRTPIKYLEVFFKDHTPKSVYGHLQDQFYNAKQQCSALKDKYTKVVKKLCDMVIGTGSDRFDVSAVHRMLHDNEFLMLQNSINQLTHDVCDSQNKGKLIYEERKNSYVSSRTTDIPSSSSQPQSMISSSKNIVYDTNQPKQTIPSLLDAPQIPILPESTSSTENQIINILLLGETGVGKSTFINAFVNYLSFDTFEQAESNKPVVLIPVSFIMTTGDNFEERTVKFNDADNSKNEDFDHPGQSVTQHCKSYIFHLKDGKKLCIIDTPGFGDTRGADQDDHNMENILEYINNLSHLNAVCFLLKPNTSRLNVFFRLCLTQLIDLLGPNICRNLAFCFTNARATFYNPGDTAPLLRNTLKSLSIDNIPFKKENTFCFDSESFRYLVALRNEIPFDEEHKNEYRMSWSTSMKESNRLIDYICTKLDAYCIQGEWQSIKHAQFTIVHMVRPILEAIRNTLRNIILRNTNFSNKTIKLCPRVIHRSAFVCLSCPQEKNQVANFWVPRDCPHEIQKTCLICSCSPDHHVRIDYILDYEFINSSSNYHQNKIDDTLQQLYHACITFAYFLIYVAHSTKDDPFRIGLERMIFQENDLRNQQKPDDFNSQLVKELIKFQREYEVNMNRTRSNSANISLSVIYNLLDSISKIPMVEKQMAAIKQGQEIIMKQYENEHRDI